VREEHLKPARDGLRVRQPDGRLLPAEGARVAITPYWLRRLNDGDVVRGKPPARAKPQPKQSEE
jgi:hypothetical protein